MALSDFLRGEQEGIRKGRIEARKEALDWLETKYMSETTERRSVEAEAILKLTRELSNYMKTRAGIDSLDG